MSPVVASAPVDVAVGRMKTGRISMPPVAASVRQFTADVRGANRANDMTAMMAAPTNHTVLAAPASVKASARAAGNIASRNDTASTQSPSACLSPANVTRGIVATGAVAVRRLLP